MLLDKWDLSRTGTGRVILVTFLGTALTIVAALSVAAYLSPQVNETTGRLMWVAAVVLPLLLSAPVMYVFARLLQKLAISNTELAQIASKDSLTTVLNRSVYDLGRCLPEPGKRRARVHRRRPDGR